MKFFLMLFLLSFVAQAKLVDPGGGKDPNDGAESLPTVSVPAVNFQSNAISETLSFTENYFDKRIVQRPEVEVNEYLGDLTTSINIPLPKSFHSLKSLNLKYNSSQILNYGYGIGMNLTLPKISIDKNNNELKILNAETPGELIPKNNLGAMARKRIEQVCNAISFKCEDVQKEYFLNQSGEDASLYLKLTSGSFVKYVQVKTNGETWIFDNDGFPERVLTAKQKGLKIIYEDGILQKLEDLDSLWQAYLSYNENSDITRSYNGAFRNSIIGLDSISISQGSTKISYDFNYSGEYLTRVSEKNSLKILFQGEYEFPKNNSFEMVHENGPVNFQKDSTLIYEADLKSVRWQTNASDNIEFHVDLNGDFYMDKVVFNQKEITDTAIAIAKEYVPVRKNKGVTYRPARSSQELESRLNGIDQKVRAFISINENGTLVYKEDSSLSLPVNDIKFLKFKVTEKNRQVEGEYQSFQVTDYSIDTTLLSIPKFVDLDNNGKKDILFCDYQDDLKSIDRTLSVTGQKQNPIAALYFDLYKNQSLDPLVNKGQIQTVYMTYPDKKKLQLQAIQNPDQKIKYLLNSTILKKISIGANTTCNQLTMPLDYNNDGVTDLLTGNQVVLFNELGATKTLSLSNDDLKKIINPPRADLDFDKNPVDLIDLKNDGTFEFVSTFGSYVDHTDRSLVYLRDSVAYKVKRKIPVKLLVKESVTFGGTAIIDYKYVAGSSLVDSILFNPAIKKNEKNRKQPAFKKSYEYSGTRLHDQLNILMGHSSSQEKVTREGALPTLKVTEFDQDFQNGPVFYLTRSRKNGRVLKQTLFDDTSAWSKITKNTFGELIDLGQDRVFSYLKTQEKTISGQGKGALITQNEFTNPVNNIVFLEELSKSIAANDQVVSQKKYSLDLDNFQVLQVAGQVKDQNGNKIQSDKVYSYNSDAELAQAFIDGVNSNFFYDKLGRIISYVDQRGKKLEFSYLKSSPLVIESKQNGSEFRYDYFDVTNFLKKSLKDQAAAVTYEWSTDEVLLTAERDGVSLYKLQYTPESNIYKIKTGDIERNYYLDGFGRIVQIDRLTDDGITVEKQVTLDENDKTIKEWIPGSENATIVTRYDSLGREVYKELSGKPRLESAVFKIKTVTKYEQNGTQTIVEDLASDLKDYKSFVRNERGDVVNHKTLSENINFFVNPKGHILGVRELGAKYSYDLYANITSTEAHSSLAAWEKMEQKFRVIENRLDSISGSSVRDAENQLILSKNSSTISPYLQNHKYEKGLIVESTSSFKDLGLKTNYTYNEEDFLSQLTIGSFSKTFKYDQYNRPIKETLDINKQHFNIESGFLKGELDSLAPFITKILYNERSAVNEIEFSNGVRATFEYDVFGKPIYHNWNVGSDNYAIDYNTNLNQGEQSKLYTSVEYTGLKQKDKSFQYDEKMYLKTKPRLSSLSKGVVFAGSNLSQIENFKFTHENDLLVKIDYKGSKSFNNFVSMDKNWQGTCPVGFSTLDECFIKINANEFISKGEYVRAIKIENQIAGVLYKEKFYPAIIDHLGSVIALVDPDGGKLAFERIYNEWGEKEQVFGDKELEKNIPWAFAGLIQHPFFNGEILQSETRIYIPSIGIWSSADNLVKWNPDALSGMPGNWNPLLYASGDPVNKADASGHFFQTMGGSILSFNSADTGELSNSFADYYGVPRGTNIYNMKDIKQLHSPEFILRMELHHPLKEIGIVAGGVAIAGAAIHAAPLAPAVGAWLALNPVTTSTISGIGNAVLENALKSESLTPPTDPVEFFLGEAIKKYMELIEE